MTFLTQRRALFSHSSAGRTRRSLHAILLGLGGLAFCLPSGAAAQEAEGAARTALMRDVVVTVGEAVVKAAPDQAFIILAVEARARSPRDAQEQMARTMSDVQQKLKGAGVPADAVRTLAVELSPEFDWSNGRQQIRGYVARNSIELRVDQLSRVGEFIDVAVQSGATNVTNIRFDVKRRDELERDALQQAVANARARAMAAAVGAGRTIDRVIRIDDTGAGPMPPPIPMLAMARKAEAAEAVTPVSAGEVEVRVRVTVTAQLK